jgi:hypothetical protein
MSNVRRFWKAAALTVALPLMLAASAAASAGQAAGSASDVAAAAKVAPASQAAALSEAFDTSCGLLPPKCTLRLNRATTRRARNAAALAGTIAAGACDPVDIPGWQTACRTVIGLSVGGLVLAASNYYEDGDCLGIEILIGPVPIASPQRVKHGDHNCS